MIFLMVPYFAAIALIALERAGLLAKRAPRTPRLPSWVWIAAIVATYALQLWILRYGATHVTQSQPWQTALPIPVLYLYIVDVDVLSASFLAGAAIQSCALLALYRTPPSRFATVAGCAVLLAMSLGAPVFASFDPYKYVFDALLGRGAYAPPSVPLQGEYRYVDLHFGSPAATPYGPLWLAVVRLATESAPTLLGKLAALRAFGAAVYAAFVALLAALRLPRRFVAVSALNAGLMLQFVANAHNDLIAIDVLLVAAAFVRRRAALGFAAIVVAGLLKLPFLALGLPVTSAVRPMRVRLAGAAAAVAAGLALSWLGGGEPYVRALLQRSLVSESASAWHSIAAVAAAAAVGLAFLGGRRFIGVPWLLPAIGAFGLPITFPWYVVWGLPYALARHRTLGFLLVAFPISSAILMPEFMRSWTVLLVIPMLVVLAARPPGSRAPRKPLPERA